MAISVVMVVAETTEAVTAARSISTTTAHRLMNLFYSLYLPKTDEQSDRQVVGQLSDLAA